jgi:hypothetical protein
MTARLESEMAAILDFPASRVSPARRRRGGARVIPISVPPSTTAPAVHDEARFAVLAELYDAMSERARGDLLCYANGRLRRDQPQQLTR